MDLKQALQTPRGAFPCCQTSAGSLLCEVINMVQSGSTWLNDCLGATSEEYSCSLSEFVTLVQDYDQRLNKVFARMDTATTDSFTAIQTNLKALLDQYFLSKITLIGNGVTCGFMGTAYKGVVDGMCYGGVWGLKAVSSSYAACAVVTLLPDRRVVQGWKLSDVQSSCDSCQILGSCARPLKLILCVSAKDAKLLKYQEVAAFAFEGSVTANTSWIDSGFW
ncbi:unnamed protein product [Symbiodinium pilosum]|uniref:Uncharacterized protein n=1 Tax=Symbiodinium pilosum TaxID=2952 RepID=A0A812XBA8_SYMPI|nr:unnamed protein product [Symbiodinium pilosum]